MYQILEMNDQIIENPFKSFWMAGFECSDQLNFHGDRVDFLNITSHLTLIDEDYERLKKFNFYTVREGLRWSQIETEPYIYDFGILEKMLLAGQKHGIQQIWDICHFGFPADLTPLHPHFTMRFAALCEAFVSYYKSFGFELPLIVTPINEVSFMSWLGGDVAATSPYCRNNGWEVKYAYMRAYIAGVKVMREVDPTVRILTTEPLVSLSANLNATQEQITIAKEHHDLQYQSVDMLCGRICPELGGKPEYLDMLGFNYYYNNQWIVEPHQMLGWNDPVPHQNLRLLSSLLTEAHERYDRPILLSETSHPREDRPVWIKHISVEITKLIQKDIPIWGVCIYPIIDRPNWDNLDDWHNSGLWDMDPESGLDSRILHQPSAHALLECQELIAASLAPAKNQNYYLKKGESTLIKS